MSQLMFLQAINQALREELRRDEKVILMGEDVHTGTFGETKGIFEEFGPERVMSTPISESGFTGTAVGAAIGGMRPVVEFMVSDFMFVAMDQLVNQAAKTRYMTGGQATIPVTFMALNMGGGGLQVSTPTILLLILCTHQGSRWLCLQPLMMPKDCSRVPYVMIIQSFTLWNLKCS